MTDKIKKEIDILDIDISKIQAEITEERKIKNPDKEDLYELGVLQGRIQTLREMKIILLSIA